MGYLNRLRACNNADHSGFLPVKIDGVRYGWIERSFLDLLAPWPDLFRLGEDAVIFAPGTDAPHVRTASLAHVGAALADQGLIHGWRGETYAVKNRWEDQPVLLAERALMPYFGFRSYGVHLNGYVRRPDGLHLWIARRANDRPNYPGMLDNTVAGGQPHDLTLMENVIKECAEEAAIPAEIARRARLTGSISYTEQPDARRIKPDRMFCFDLELPDGFVPRNTDGEIASFSLMPVADVMELVRYTRDFKPNCAMALIHFFLQHGLLTRDNEPDHDAIVEGLDRDD